MNNIVFVVCNDYQGIHYFGKTKEDAQHYIDSKVTNTYGSCWNRDAWHIVEQPLNSDSVLEDFESDD